MFVSYNNAIFMSLLFPPSQKPRARVPRAIYHRTTRFIDVNHLRCAVGCVSVSFQFNYIFPVCERADGHTEKPHTTNKKTPPHPFPAQTLVHAVNALNQSTQKHPAMRAVLTDTCAHKANTLWGSTQNRRHIIVKSSPRPLLTQNAPR